MSVFEPYPMRDTVQHFCEKHLDKIKAYMESLSGVVTMLISVSLLFVKKVFDPMGGKSMTLIRGDILCLCSSQQLLHLVCGPLKGFFSRLCTQHGSSTWPYALPLELQRNKDMCSARCGGPRTLSKTTGGHIDCVFVKKHVSTVILDCEKPIL